MCNNNLKTLKSKAMKKHGDWLLEFSKNQEFQKLIMGQWPGIEENDIQFFISYNQTRPDQLN